MKIKFKRFITLCLCMLTLTLPINSFAAVTGVTYIHGNLNDEKKCYAKTKQNSDNYTIAAKITWQVSGSNAVQEKSRVSGTGQSVTCKSSNLKNKKGKSFGYYYVNGKQTHKSSAWMNFSF